MCVMSMTKQELEKQIEKYIAEGGKDLKIPDRIETAFEFESLLGKILVSRWLTRFPETLNSAYLKSEHRSGLYEWFYTIVMNGTRWHYMDENGISDACAAGSDSPELIYIVRSAILRDLRDNENLDILEWCVRNITK